MFPKGCETSWLYECFHSPVPPSVDSELKTKFESQKIESRKFESESKEFESESEEFESEESESDPQHDETTHQLWVNETLAQDEVRVWEVGQCFQEDADNIVSLEAGRIELVQLQNSQIRFQIVCVFCDLSIHVLLQCWQVLWIVPVESTVTFTSTHHTTLPFNATEHFSHFKPHLLCQRHPSWWKTSCWESRNVDQTLRCRRFGGNDACRKVAL